MNWISIDDKLPEMVRQYEMFLVVTDKGIGTAVYDSLNEFSRIIVSGSTQYSHYTVTHWMRLPEPPTAK
ncbi:DUF551 domain-containing protein [Photorhabdus cinerea]|uniref:DUF551 domain-containing protein n=1 Tax=Photorhabdus cinerea TaxID=471575 RepID=A0A7X5TI44_9GAMM|nr:DUF551 domain-containing protein [Photorhabdus cinerea]NHB93153.1 hypothetical protein [Photorhabdus cinerea]